MNVFISRDALEYGIFKAEGYIFSKVFFYARYIFPNNKQDGGKSENLYEEKEWHKTPEEAVARANEMVKEHIAKLNKELKKLKKTKFTYGGCKDERISSRTKRSARSKVGC